MQITVEPTENSLLSYIYEDGKHPIDLFLEKGVLALNFGVLLEHGEIIEQSDDYIDFMSRLECISMSKGSKKYIKLMCEKLLSDYPELVINL